ncbi:hypothetical protein PG2006B_1497 [Bifidobacterium animalis subsp. animalis]|nr:hypothetical protein PG2006B_1497 [Bifidobacterium animalis subsp. animalis]
MNTPMNPPMRFRKYYLPADKETALLPTCVPGAKPEPLLIPEYLFDNTEEEQTKPENGNNEYTTPADHDQ